AAVHLAGVADLAAHLGVARAAVEDDGGLVLERHDFQDRGLHREGVEANELRGRGGLDLRKRNDFLLLRGAGAGALFFHQIFKTVLVHGQAAFARHQLGEVERETVGVVKLESEVTGNLGSAPAPGAVSRALAGNLVRRRLSRWRWSPQPLIILRRRNNSVVPRIATY